MDFTFSAKAYNTRTPFYPFDRVVRRLLTATGGRDDAMRRIHRSPLAQQRALEMYMHPRISGFVRSLMLLEAPGGIVRNTLRDLMQLVFSLAKDILESNGNPECEHSTRTLRIRIRNASYLPQSFLPLAGHIIEICHEKNISMSISLDCWSGAELPLGVWADNFDGCGWPDPGDAVYSSGEKVREELLHRNLSMKEIVRVYLCDAVEEYQHRLVHTIFSSEAELEARQWAWLMLSRSQIVDKVIPKILAELVKPGEVDQRLLFVLNLGIGAYYYDHNYLDEASRFFEHAYIQCRNTSPSVMQQNMNVHPQIQCFFWLKMGDLLSKNREYLQEPAQVFYRRALAISQEYGELLTIQAHRGLAYHMGVESVFDQAHREIAMALDMARKMGYVQEMFNCRRILGAIYQMQGMTTEAVEQLQRALLHSDHSETPLEVAKIHNTIAYIEMVDGHFSASLNSSIQAVQLLINEFHPRYVEEITNALNTMTELAIFSGNLLAALRLLHFNMELASSFSSRRSERHWNLIQSFRYMTYVHWRLDQPGQAGLYLARYERNIRRFEHFINTFELNRYRLLMARDLPDDKLDAEIERIIEPLMPHLETTIHVRIMLVQFYLDLHRKTCREAFRRRAAEIADRFRLQHIYNAYTNPVPIDWSGMDKRIPFNLLSSFVDSDKRFKTLQSTLYRYDTVHEFSQRIINENSVEEVIDYLFPIVRSQLEADAMYLYLSTAEGFMRIPDTSDPNHTPEEQIQQDYGVQGPADPAVHVVTGQTDQVLAWAERELQRGGLIFPAELSPAPAELEGRSVMIGEMKTLSGRTGLLVVANSPDFHWIYTEEDQNVLTNLMDLFSLKMENLEFIQRLENQSRLDDLTGVYNKRMLEPTLQELYAVYQRHQTPFSMIILDGDDFKLINDTHGHLYGDSAIQKTAETISSCIRTVDKLIRFGGDEFMVFLPGAELKDAREVAERIRRTLADTICTASIGVGQFSSRFENTDRFFQAVDRAMYIAKRRKNTVVAVDSP